MHFKISYSVAMTLYDMESKVNDNVALILIFVNEILYFVTLYGNTYHPSP